MHHDFVSLVVACHTEEIRIGLLAPQPGVWDFFGSTFSTMVTLALEDIKYFETSLDLVL